MWSEMRDEVLGALGPGVEARLAASDPDVLDRTEEIMSGDGAPPRAWKAVARGLRKRVNCRRVLGLLGSLIVSQRK